MKITYDQDVDALTIVLKAEATIEESDESQPGVVLDYDRAGNLVSIEVLDASKRTPDITNVEFSVIPAHDFRSA